MDEASTIEALRGAALPIESDEHIDKLLELIGDASIVLLGEASHGTREFYRLRAEISKRLITDKHFDAIAVEADWPDALQASRYVQLASSDQSADEALRAFKRFPQWMWRNAEVLDFLQWLRNHNASLPPSCRATGFFGLDLYSMHKSMEAVIAYLDRADPAAAGRARARYGCFDHLDDDPRHYGYATSFGMRKDCQEEVVNQLCDLMAHAASHLSQEDGCVPDTLFYAVQNARVVKNSESYYRAMFESRDQSWNVRDVHMAETLDALRAHLGQHKRCAPKIAVWAHNSHLGDARATEVSMHGQLNLGQLARQRYRPGQTFLLGFTTHAGTVTAATDWGGHAEMKQVIAARPDSIEHLFHQTGLGRFILPLGGTCRALEQAGLRYLERAIGVIYRPESERASHYFYADVNRQFDAVIHIDRSTAVRPLEYSPRWRRPEEVPETYPFGV